MTNQHERSRGILTAILTFVCLVCIHCTHVFSFYYTKTILVSREHLNNAPTTTAVGLHHTGALRKNENM